MRVFPWGAPGNQKTKGQKGRLGRTQRGARKIHPIKLRKTLKGEKT